MSLAALEPYKDLRNYPRWVFVIYRCDYRSDSAWNQFITRWSERVNDWLVRMNEQRLTNNLVFTVHQDQSFNGATVQDVRRLFTSWTDTADEIAEMHAAAARFCFCVHVDAAALDSCLRFDALPQDTQGKFWSLRRDPALGCAPYVNIVRKSIQAIDNYAIDREKKEEDPADEEESDSEEEEEPDVIKAHWLCVLPDIYSGLDRSMRFFQTIVHDVDTDGVCIG